MEKEEKMWLIFLILVAVTFNTVTLVAVPWQEWNFWSAPEPEKEFYIRISNYTFYLPPDGMIVKVGEPVRFVVTSDDVTYGFGVFKSDGTLVFQIQVLPNYNNTIIWIFDEPGNYTIRSTEYSGPEHIYMVVPDAIRVVE